MRGGGGAIGVAILGGLVLACDAPTKPVGDGTPPSADRTLVMTECASMYNTTMPLPCTTYSTGTVHTWVDSARLILRRDFTASWMKASTTRTVPCGFSSCAETTKTVSTIQGTYQIADNTIVFMAAAGGSLTYYGSFPADIDSHWVGPDSLALPSGPPTHSSIILTPP